MTRNESGHGQVTTISVRSRQGDYPVLVGRGLLGRLPALLGAHAPAFRYAVISDERVAGIFGQGVLDACREGGLDAELFTFPDGEANKTRAQWSVLTDALLEWGLGRDGAIVALGGGVTGDLAGFVAATYLRGVPLVQVPTSLVAMIDASVGGKTGVDVPAGKNLVGSFHPPRVVVADPETGATLDRAERAQGYAEAVKHGSILDPEYLRFLRENAEDLLAGDAAPTLVAVEQSVQIKADVVSRDEEEGGLRQILNFGHTVGHALEAASGYGLGHGTAIAAGMILEARLGEELGVTERGTAAGVGQALGRFGLDRPLRGLLENPSRVLSYLDLDKKARRGRARFVLLERIGSVHDRGGWTHDVPIEVVRRLLAEFAERHDAEGEGES
ncbi:MAG: 3-dehydroquinate synthase [Gemmatimonadota bacterium]